MPYIRFQVLLQIITQQIDFIVKLARYYKYSLQEDQIGQLLHSHVRIDLDLYPMVLDTQLIFSLYFVTANDHLDPFLEFYFSFSSPKVTVLKLLFVE